MKHERLGRNRYMTNTGYVRIRVRRGRDRRLDYVLEHRYIMETHLGRRLRKNEHIHHINGNKTDNRIENLEICRSNSEHIQKHIANGTWRGGRKRIRDKFSELKCSGTFKSWLRSHPTHPATLRVLNGTYRWGRRGPKELQDIYASLPFTKPYRSWLRNNPTHPRTLRALEKQYGKNGKAKAA